MQTECVRNTILKITKMSQQNCCVTKEEVFHEFLLMLVHYSFPQYSHFENNQATCEHAHQIV